MSFCQCHWVANSFTGCQYITYKLMIISKKHGPQILDKRLQYQGIVLSRSCSHGCSHVLPAAVEQWLHQVNGTETNTEIQVKVLCAYIKGRDERVQVAGRSIVKRVVEVASLQLIFSVHFIQRCIQGCRCTHLVQQTWTTTCTTFRSHPHTVDELQQLAETITQLWTEPILTLHHTSIELSWVPVNVPLYMFFRIRAVLVGSFEWSMIMTSGHDLITIVIATSVPPGD